LWRGGSSVKGAKRLEGRCNGWIILQWYFGGWLLFVGPVAK